MSDFGSCSRRNLLAIGHAIEELIVLLLIHGVNSNVKVPLLAVVVHIPHFALPAVLTGAAEWNLGRCRCRALVDNHKGHRLVI